MTPSGAANEERSRHRLSIDDYHRMAEVGILDKGSRVELINGEIIDMTPIGSKHAAGVARLARQLERSVNDQAIVWIQNPIVLLSDSEPEPDLALLLPKANFYSDALPTADDVILVIEVADTTLAYDRDIKVPLYAQNGIPEVWLFDVEHNLVVVYHTPVEGAYRHAAAPEQPQLLPVQQLPQVFVNLTSLS